MKTIIKNVRIAFAHGIFNAQKSENGNLQYSATFLFDKNHAAKKQLDDVIDAVGKEAFTKEWPAIKKDKLAKDKLIIHDGDLKSNFDGFEDNYYVIAYNKIRPAIRNADTSVLVEEDNVIYSGCYVDVILDISAYSSKNYGKQISATLMGVQFRRDGDAFTGGAPKAEDTDFENLSNGADAGDLA